MSRLRYFQTITFICLLIASSISYPAQLYASLADTPWPTSNHDMQRTGRSNAAGPTKPKIKWIKTGIFSSLGNGEMKGGTIGNDGKLYVAAGTGGVAALDKQTGNKIWEFRIVNLANGSPGPDIGDVAEKWVNYPPTIGTDGTLYITSEWGWAAALDPTTGIAKWYVQSGKTETSAAIDGDSIYFYSWNDNFYSYSIGNGFPGLASPGDPKNQTSSRMKWRYKKTFGTMGFTYGLPALDSQGNVYFAYEGLFGFYPDKKCTSTLPTYPAPIPSCPQQLIGTINLGQLGQGYGWYGPILDEERHAAYYTNHKEVYAVDIGTVTNGSYTKKWNTPFSLGSRSKGRVPALGADGTIFAGSDNGFFAINPDGTQKWKASIGRINGNPVIDKNGIVYVYTTVGTEQKLYALNPTTGAVLPNYPLTISTISIGNFADQTISMDSDGTIYVPYGINDMAAITQDGLSPTATPSYLRSDFGGQGGVKDGAVDIQDFNILASEFYTTGINLKADIIKDTNNRVDIQDYSAFTDDYRAYLAR